MCVRDLFVFVPDTPVSPNNVKGWIYGALAISDWQLAISKRFEDKQVSKGSGRTGYIDKKPIEFVSNTPVSPNNVKGWIYGEKLV